jgi:ribosomal protein S18 acetylase RimI-like enzyme
MMITKAGPEDAATLQEIATQTFTDTFSSYNTPENMQQYLRVNLSLEQLTAELSNPDSAFYFVHFQNKITGYLKLNFGSAQTELQDEHALEIERIYVLREYQGKKVGQLLYEFAVSIAAQKQLEYIWLAVWENNKRAISFYEKNGFVSFDQHLFKLGDDEQTDLMMKKALTTPAT